MIGTTLAFMLKMTAYIITLKVVGGAVDIAVTYTKAKMMTKKGIKAQE